MIKMIIAQRAANHKEVVGRANSIRTQTDLTRHPGFSRKYEPLTPGGEPVGHFRYVDVSNHLILLRFSQATSLWTITCPELSMEFHSINRPPQDLAEIIKGEVKMAALDPDWLTETLPETAGPQW